jgi:hypothetical protein
MTTTTSTLSPGSFSAKDPSDIVQLAFDLSDVITSPDTIASSTWAVTTVSGYDASPSSLLSGAPATSGYQVKQLFTGGIDGVTYLVRATVTSSTGARYVIPGYLPVRSAG